MTQIRDANRHRIDNACVTINPFDWAVIVHEAAHLTIGASRLGLEARRVEFVWENGVWEDGDVFTTDGLNGYSRIIEGPKLTSWLVMLLAGETAERAIFGRHMLPRHHPGSDRERLYDAVVRAGRMGQQALFVARQQAPRLVHVHRGAILQLAHDLGTLVDRAQGADVCVEGDELGRLLGPDVAILRRAAV